MKQSTPAENVAILRSELKYFINRLAVSRSEERKYIEFRIKQIKKEIKGWSHGK